MNILGRWCASGILSVILGFGAVTAAPDSLTANFGFHFLEEPIHPRQLAMGAAGTALPGGGFAFYNPALPALLAEPYLSLEYGQYPAGDLVVPQVEGAWSGEKWFTGLNFQTYTVSDIPLADERGVNPYLTTSWQESMLFVALGIKKKRYALAVQAEGLHARVQGNTSYGIAASGGIMYTVVPGKLYLGAAGFHAGETTSFLGEDKKLGDGAGLPIHARAGVSWADTVGTTGYRVAIDGVYRYTNKQIIVPAGVEINPIAPLAIRVGKRFNHESELFACGVGFTAAPMEFDLGFAVPKLVSDKELKWRFRLTYVLQSEDSRKSEAREEISDLPENPVVTEEDPVAEEPGEIEGFTEEIKEEQQPRDTLAPVDTMTTGDVVPDTIPTPPEAVRDTVLQDSLPADTLGNQDTASESPDSQAPGADSTSISTPAGEPSEVEQEPTPAAEESHGSSPEIGQEQ